MLWQVLVRVRCVCVELCEWDGSALFIFRVLCLFCLVIFTLPRLAEVAQLCTIVQTKHDFRSKNAILLIHVHGLYILSAIAYV